MSILDKFNICTGGDWITGGFDVQYKVVDRVLYFQCSHGAHDWKENFKIGHDVYPCTDICFKAHDGFSELWLSVKEEIEKLDFDTVVGYSQGAALAGFAHENYFHRKGIQPTAWVFGCPRFIYKPSPELELRFTNFIRYSNLGDFVTMLPPAILGYKHVGQYKLLKHMVKKPKNVKLLDWISGYSAAQYRLELEKYGF
jgi:hypothetical protein